MTKTINVFFAVSVNWNFTDVLSMASVLEVVKHLLMEIYTIGAFPCLLKVKGSKYKDTL